MVQSILDFISEILPKIGNMFSSAFESVIAVFYNAGGADGEGGLTVFGGLALVGAGIALIRFAFNYIIKFIKQIK